MEDEVQRMIKWANENDEDWKIVYGVKNVGIERNRKIHKSLVDAELHVLSNMMALRIYHMVLEDLKDEIEIV